MFDTMAAAPGAGRWPMIVAAARGCIGTRFRPQGRLPGLGLDCVGVALVAAAAAGIGRARVPAYALGGDHAGAVEPVLAAIGCVATDAPLPGDLLVMAPSPGRRHLGIATPAGAVHADAGIGRVVEAPIHAGWAIIGAWRLPGAR